MNKPAALQLLEPFIGVWRTSGTLTATNATHDLIIQGTDTYEWISGGFFVLHKVDVMMGEEHSESIEIIGYDEQQNVFTMHSFDSKGAITRMTAFVKGDIWVFEGAGLRFTGGFSANGLILSGNWDQQSDSNWNHFIRINLTKQL